MFIKQIFKPLKVVPDFKSIENLKYIIKLKNIKEHFIFTVL